MNIRLAELTDAPQLTDLAVQTMREAFGPPHNPAELVDEYIAQALTLPIVEHELQDPRATFLLAEADNELMGYAKLRRHAPPRQMPQSYRQCNPLEIQRIYLLQAHVGQGRGQALMQHCLKTARAQACGVVWLGVWERNERALSFYKKIGFERFGFHYFQFGSERQRDYWMLKEL
ncbi:GCN5-related N-acetyltransferase [Fibrisoma limi BUZ 3]|uniref:GCN5-related N-acetyltransferase n=1 Tax=Fibrisoma limi BUZ 3 TaxID=1185876 RepID=I2GJ14_9BACT|nr:GNAT family N-acetyltransferase [Fibrisoma limi]CCH53889.1 GCN5-related N-acetyltransferase [Fibrisoma limi BUZ 3]